MTEEQTATEPTAEDRKATARVVERMAGIGRELEEGAVVSGIMTKGEPMQELEMVAGFVEDGPAFVRVMQATFDEEKNDAFLSGITFGILAERGRREAQEAREQVIDTGEQSAS